MATNGWPSWPSWPNQVGLRGWEVRPATRFLSTPIGDEDLVRLAKLHSRYGEALFKKRNPSRRGDFPEVPALSSHDLATCMKFEHELDHLQRHASTSLGFLLHRLATRRVDLFFERLDLATEDESARLPWYPRSLAARGPWFKESNPVARNQQLFQAYRDLEEMLLCINTSPTAPIAQSIERQESAERALWGHLCPGVTAQASSSRELRIRARLPGSTRHLPFLPGSTGPFARLGGQALLEWLAVSREITLISAANLQHSADASLFKAKIYQLAPLCWRNWARLPLAKAPQGSASSTGISRPPAAVYPVELLLAIDLALWPPFWPDGFRGDDLHWEDIHPGWRFLQIIDWFIGRMRPTTTPLRYDQLTDRWMRGLQSEICSALRWPSPDVLCSEWRSKLAEWERVGSTGGFFIEDDLDRLRLSVELLATREKSPSQFALGYANPRGRSFHWFAGVSATDSCDPYVNEATMIEIQREGYRLHVAEGLLQGLELFGEELAYPSLRGSTRLRFENLGSKVEQVLLEYGRRHYSINGSFDRSQPWARISEGPGAKQPD